MLSVRIDVDQLLRDREAERNSVAKFTTSGRTSQEAGSEDKPRKKRKSEVATGGSKPKKSKPNDSSTVVPKHPKITVTLKLGPKPPAPEPFPCCLCVNMSKVNLLRVHDPPIGRRDVGADGQSGTRGSKEWMAHEDCANVVPETWVDHVEVGEPRVDGSRAQEKVVFGVDGIVKDRWNLVCVSSQPVSELG